MLAAAAGRGARQRPGWLAHSLGTEPGSTAAGVGREGGRARAHLPLAALRGDALGHIAKDFGIGAGPRGGRPGQREGPRGQPGALGRGPPGPCDAQGRPGGWRGGPRAARPGSAGLRCPRGGQGCDERREERPLGLHLAARFIRNGRREGPRRGRRSSWPSRTPIAATDPRTLNAEKALQVSRKQDLGRDLTDKIEGPPVHDAERGQGLPRQRPAQGSQQPPHQPRPGDGARFKRRRCSRATARSSVPARRGPGRVSAKSLDKARALFDGVSAKVEKGEFGGGASSTT